MLRIKGEAPPEAPMPNSEEAPDEQAQPDLQALLGERAGAGQVDPATAGYRGPEQGPFMCSNCSYWEGSPEGGGQCSIVSGAIDPNGICNLFTTLASQDQEQAPEEGAQPPEGLEELAGLPQEG